MLGCGEGTKGLRCRVRLARGWGGWGLGCPGVLVAQCGRALIVKEFGMARRLGYPRISMAELWLAKLVVMPKDSGWQISGCPAVWDAQGFGLEELWWSEMLRSLGCPRDRGWYSTGYLGIWGDQGFEVPKDSGWQSSDCPQVWNKQKFKMPKVAEL